MASYIILASKGLSFVHLLVAAVLIAEIVAVGGLGVARSRRIRKRRHSVVVGFGISLDQMLLLLSLAVIFGIWLGAVSAIHLCWTAPLIACSIFVIPDHFLAWSHGIVASVLQFTPVDWVCDVLRAVGHAAHRVGVALLCLDYLAAVVLVTESLLVILHLVPSAAHGSLPLSCALLLQLVVQQLILIQIIGKRQFELDLLVLWGSLASIFSFLHFDGETEIFRLLVDALSWICRHCFGVLRRQCLIIDELKMLAIQIFYLCLSLGLRLAILGSVAVHGEEGHSGAALGVNSTDFLFGCRLRLVALLWRRGSHRGSRIGPSFGHIWIVQLRSFKCSHFLLFKCLAQLGSSWLHL